MCGIFGVYGPIEDAALSRAMDALRTRGPDGSGSWSSRHQASTPPGGVTLGHTRLSIIGLDSGAQPILSHDGKMAVVVNGEFYGHEEIRETLSREGYAFRTKSDSEIALALYRKHGLDFLSHLRGEFALILWDEGAGRFIAARDRFGIKPLVYGKVGDSFLYASNAKALFAAGLKPQFDHASLFQAFGAQYTLPGTSLFAGVAEVLPGQLVIHSRSGRRAERYWDMDLPVASGGGAFFGQYPAEAANGDSESHGSIDAMAKMVRDSLEEAVTLRLKADVPVAFHLSGGLDSTSVVALAARHLTSPVCYTVSFGDDAYDEAGVAQRSAEKIGAELRTLRLSGLEMLESMEKAAEASEGLSINSHLGAKFLLAKKIRGDGFKVVLSGEGADEVLFGYAHLLADHELDLSPEIRRDLVTEVERTVVSGIHLPTGEGLPLKAVEKTLGYVPTFLRAKAGFGFRMQEILNQEFKTSFSGRDPYQDLLSKLDASSQLTGRERVAQSSYIWTKTALASYILKTLGDGTEMPNGVEGRLPFLDHRFYEAVRGMTTSLKIRGGMEKFILREAMRGLITEEVYKRRKHPFMAPPSIVDRSCLEFVMDHLRSQAFRDMPYFDSERLAELAQRILGMSAQEKSASDPVIMMALSTFFVKKGILK